jgi:hypothetical protein
MVMVSVLICYFSMLHYYNPTMSNMGNIQRMVKCISLCKKERRERHGHLPYKAKDSWIHMLRIKSKNDLCCKGSRKRYAQHLLGKFPCYASIFLFCIDYAFLFYLIIEFMSYFLSPHIIIYTYKSIT